MPSTKVKDIKANDFIEAYAAYLKRSGKLEVPKWTDLVKTGTFKEQSPASPDWFYVRVAAIARKVYLETGLGVGTLTKYHGGAKRRGALPSKHCAGSGSVIRKALQSLEKMKVVEKDQNGGRRLTQIGRQELDRIAQQIGAQ